MGTPGSAGVHEQPSGTRDTNDMPAFGMTYSGSSGWRYITTGEMAIKFAKGEVDEGVSGFMYEVGMRGMRIAECAECGMQRVQNNHDYICLLCRIGD